MLRCTFIAFFLTVTLVVATEPMQSVHGIILTEAERVAMNSVDTPAVAGQTVEGRGNGLIRALKAPFKAIGRLFGGKKKDNKLQRISAKDAKRFESAPGAQVSQTTPAAEATSSRNVPDPTSSDNPAAARSTGNTGDSSGFESNANNSSADALAISAMDHLAKGRALLNSHDLNGAIGQLSIAASANPNLSEASSLMGVAYWRKGLRDLAEKSFETAVNIEKADPQNLNNLGFLLYENGDYEKAIKYLKRAAKLAPDDPRIWNNLGLAQSERGQFDDAFKSFARAQGEYKGHLNVANRLERQGSTKQAIKHLEKAVALQPNSPNVLVKLITLYNSSGNEKLAQSARNSLETLRALAQTAVK